MTKQLDEAMTKQLARRSGKLRNLAEWFVRLALHNRGMGSSTALVAGSICTKTAHKAIPVGWIKTMMSESRDALFVSATQDHAKMLAEQGIGQGIHMMGDFHGNLGPVLVDLHAIMEFAAETEFVVRHQQKRIEELEATIRSQGLNRIIK